MSTISPHTSHIQVHIQKLSRSSRTVLLEPNEQEPLQTEQQRDLRRPGWGCLLSPLY